MILDKSGFKFRVPTMSKFSLLNLGTHLLAFALDNHLLASPAFPLTFSSPSIKYVDGHIPILPESYKNKDKGTNTIGYKTVST